MRAISAFAYALSCGKSMLIESIAALSSRQISLSSPNVSFLSTDIASTTSRVLPTHLPNGTSMFVIRARTFLPQCFPMATIFFASSSADFRSCINAPLPTLTSKTMDFAPAASFLDITLDAISGTESTVAVTSLKAYSFLSAGTIFPVWLITQTPILLT